MTARLRDIVGRPTREDRMGFMDKAKKLAEQAQEKLDEAQKNFNQGGSEQPTQGGVRYDEHGRPIQQETPAAATPPPAAAPAEGAATPDPTAPIGDANATPGPFKPLQ